MNAPLARLLLAEDDADLRGLLADGLRRFGYDVITAVDGREALVALTEAARDETRRPDVVVMDIRMPVLSGIEILQGIRTASWDTPVILITGFGDALTHERAYMLGAWEVLDKPLTLSRLAVAVENARSRRSM